MDTASLSRMAVSDSRRRVYKTEDSVANPCSIEFEALAALLSIFSSFPLAPATQVAVIVIERLRAAPTMWWNRMFFAVREVPRVNTPVEL